MDIKKELIEGIIQELVKYLYEDKIVQLACNRVKT